LADNPSDNKPAILRQVTRTLTHSTLSLVELQTDANGDGRADGSFQATPNHLMWTTSHGWVQAGDLIPGDTLQDETGASVCVLAATAFNQTCNTYNLGVAEDHSFFVLSGATPVLAHNINPGPRAWIIYQAEEIINGVVNAYIGRASMPCDSKSFSARKVFETRYSKTGRVLKRKLPAGGVLQRDFNHIKVLHEFWDDGTPSGIPGSSGGMKSKGEVTAQALEAFEEFKWREHGKSLNTIKPLRGTNPRFDDILDFGDNYLRARNGGQVCAGLVRLR
jgi:hypothetical protein